VLLPGASLALVPVTAPAPRLKRFPVVPALFRRREVWLPTAWGLLLGLLILAGVGALLARGAYGFFAVDAPLPPRDGMPTPVVVVEGWIDEEALSQAAALVRSAGYPRVIVSGGPIDDSFSRFPNFAARAAETLRPQLPAGVRVDVVPSPRTAQDRSYASAVWVRDWAQREGLAMDRFDVITHSIHARRTRLVYRMAFGPDAAVGIRSTEPRQFDAPHWWRSSAAFKAQIGEALSLAYTHCCFWPAPRGSHEERWAVPPSGAGKSAPSR